MGTTVTLLTDRLAVAAGQLNAVHAGVVGLVAEMLDTDAWAVDGIRTPVQWLGWQLGITAGEAERLIALARARTTHPTISAMFDEGRLSLTQAAIATTVAPHRDSEIAEVAVACTVSQLRLFARAMATSDTTHDGLTPAPEPVETMSFHIGDNGWMKGRFTLDAEHAAVFNAAITQARDALFHDQQHTTEPATARTVNGPVTWTAALVEMAERSLDAATPVSRRERFRINVFFDPDVDWSTRWTNHSPVPDWLADKLACDGTISPIFTAAGRPVSVGRTWRTVPERTRRLVEHRDGGHCRIPWCQHTRGLHIHHLVTWAHGGPTDTANLITVCRHCHDTIHRGDLHVTGHADQPHGLHYHNRSGRPITYTTTPQPPHGQPPPQPRHPYTHPHGERLHHNDIWVNPPPPGTREPAA